jgi:multidrug efflux pump subunit AcrA (membrane-fusion protein)
VEAVAVRGASTDGDLTVSGRLERERQAALSFRIGGAVTSLTVDAGDRVGRGQVIATVDPAGVQARLRQASADLEKARRDMERDRKLAERGFVSGARMADRGSAVAVASAAYDAVAFDARYARLVSPVSGPVLERRVQAGEVVQPGQAVVVVADESSPFRRARAGARPRRRPHPPGYAGRRHGRGAAPCGARWAASANKRRPRPARSRWRSGCPQARRFARGWWWR